MEIRNTGNINIVPSKYANNVKNRYCGYQSVASDSVSFTSHSQSEKFLKNGINRLILQTAFNREPETKEFVCRYIRDNLGHKNKIKIVSAGCSTGEEAVSYSMHLHDMKDKVDILGFDISENAVKQAQSGKFLFEIPKNDFDFMEEFGVPSPCTDSYLLSGSDKDLTAGEKRIKSIFGKFFEPTGEKIRTPFGEWLANQIKKLAGIKPLEYERKTYRLKEGMATNCTFQQGDVNDIETILNGEKADVISFCNSLYHLITFGEPRYRKLRSDSKSIIEKLMSKFKNCLNENGIVVFDENEIAFYDEKSGELLKDGTTVPQVMRKLGFQPLNGTSEHAPNVWRRGK